MIAVDTNLLVYAHRPEMPFHERAREVLTGAVGGSEPVSVPWPCAHEFLAVVSNPRSFRDPTPMDAALDAVGRLLNSLGGGFLAEGEGYLRALERIARPALLQGAAVHDARIAALCLYQGGARALVRGPRLLAIPRLGGGQPTPRGLTAARTHCRATTHSRGHCIGSDGRRSR